MSKRQAFPTDYLDAMTAEAGDTAKTALAVEPRKTAKKVSAAFRVDADLLDRARNAVYWLSGPPERPRLVEIVERGIRAELRKLEKKYNDGQPFDQRESDLSGGG